MTFTARDLMMQVFPAQGAVPRLACEAITMPPMPYPKPKPKPPKPKPPHLDHDSPHLTDLDVLREQLHRALRT
jgi:hypothetical protein